MCLWPLPPWDEPGLGGLPQWGALRSLTVPWGPALPALWDLDRAQSPSKRPFLSPVGRYGWHQALSHLS